MYLLIKDSNINRHVMEQIKFRSLFFWRTGGGGHFECIIKEEALKELGEYDINKANMAGTCTTRDLIDYLQSNYWDVVYIPKDFPQDPVMYVFEKMMGFMIGKKGFRVKAMSQIIGRRIKLIKTKRAGFVYKNWLGGRYGAPEPEHSECHNCDRKLGNAQKLNRAFLRCECGELNVLV
nr:MAG: hypothetical protein [Lokiarchaeota virus Skoll Meg22_1214]